MQNKLTDNEILKALECCTKLRYDIQQPPVCVNCPYYNLDDCTFELKSKALDLINRQKAEIERLNKEVDRLSQCVLYNDGIVSDLERDLYNAKAEAVTEFTERLKEKAHKCFMGADKAVTVSCISNLLKEMVGDNQ